MLSFLSRIKPHRFGCIRGKAQVLHGLSHDSSLDLTDVGNVWVRQPGTSLRHFFPTMGCGFLPPGTPSWPQTLSVTPNLDLLVNLSRVHTLASFSASCKFHKRGPVRNCEVSFQKESSDLLDIFCCVCQGLWFGAW